MRGLGPCTGPCPHSFPVLLPRWCLPGERERERIYQRDREANACRGSTTSSATSSGASWPRTPWVRSAHCSHCGRFFVACFCGLHGWAPHCLLQWRSGSEVIGRVAPRVDAAGRQGPVSAWRLSACSQIISTPARRQLCRHHRSRHRHHHRHRLRSAGAGAASTRRSGHASACGATVPAPPAASASHSKSLLRPRPLPRARAATWPLPAA